MNVNLLVLLFVALFAISNVVRSESLLSIQTYQYSPSHCDSSDSGSSSDSDSQICDNSDTTGQVIASFDKCVQFNNIPSVFTLSSSNSSVTLSYYNIDDTTCQSNVETTEIIPLGICNHGCPSAPTSASIIQRNDVVIPLDTVVKLWFDGECNEGAWKNTFKLIDIAIAFKCINLGPKQSAMLSCVPSNVKVSFAQTANNCRFYSSSVDIPLGLTCGDNQVDNVDFFCNSS